MSGWESMLSAGSAEEDEDEAAAAVVSAVWTNVDGMVWYGMVKKAVVYLPPFVPFVFIPVRLSALASTLEPPHCAHRIRQAAKGVE